MPLDWLCGDSPSEVHDKERTDASSDKGGRGGKRAAHVMPHTSSAADGPGRLAKGGWATAATATVCRRQRVMAGGKEARGVAGNGDAVRPAGMRCARNLATRGGEGDVGGGRDKLRSHAHQPLGPQTMQSCPRHFHAKAPVRVNALVLPWLGLLVPLCLPGEQANDNRFITDTIVAHDVIAREQRLIAWA